MSTNVFYRFLISYVFILFISCSTPRTVVHNPEPTAVKIVPVKPATIPETAQQGDFFFEELFKQKPGIFDSIIRFRKEWNVQLIYTEINRDKNGRPSLVNHYFNKEGARYFYPASTVKLPVVLLALQKINELSQYGITRESIMVTDAAYSGQAAAFNDPNTPDGKPSVAGYIKRILMVSDNDAYNRLYEFLGQDYINQQLHDKGYSSAQILHRLDIFLTEDENRHTNPVSFFNASNGLLYKQPAAFNRKPFEKRSDYIGDAYYSNGELINRAMVFSNKNRLSLPDLQRILQSLVFPQTVAASERFNISEADRQFVLKYMSQYPSESVFPWYDSSYNKAYVKFLLYGGKDNGMNNHIRIFNKVGDAYGQLVDVAYIADFKEHVEFMLSAAIYCNTDGVLNDDKYDYETIGLPFMKNLGELIYRYELGRKKNNKPDLSSFIFSYDK